MMVETMSTEKNACGPKVLEGALSTFIKGVIGPLSRARAEISCDKRTVGEEGRNTFATFVVPLYRTRDLVGSRTKIIFSPFMGTASRAGIFLTAPKMILLGQSLATSILINVKLGWLSENTKQIMF